ncbi:MAG: FAD-binding protein [Deltaproteobacteria bacterium]|nr:FAD-binding protein [Deltaproteobacteria bacterium]MBM4324152.1 FAD-binding protein [Deltaproteobacteria bacterium]MBM4347745.1 FAD-binding protein [Deltaproteobacteria bacterium]
MKKKVSLKLPPMAMSLQSTFGNKTGTWRYLRPVLIEGIATCNETCLVAQDIERMIFNITEGKFEEAYAQLAIENPMPSVLGRVCPHPCEESCNRRQYDKSVSIKALERFIGDYGLKQGRPVVPLGPMRREKIAVIGSGPAGLSCAYYLGRMGYKVTIFEAMPVLGGKLRWAIPDYRLPKTILDQEIKKILSLGIRVQKNVKVGRDFSFKDLKQYQAIFIATGGQRSMPLHVPGEDSRDVVSGLEFLKSLNLGDDIPLGSKPVVIGGGNTAIDVSRSCLRLGSEPMILYRRSKEEMPAYRDEVEEAEGEGVLIRYLVAPLRVIREKGRVTGLECLNVRMGKPDASGRRSPIPIQGSNFFVETDQVIRAIGEELDHSFLPREIRAGKGFIEVNPYAMTSQPGVFAGGDAITQPRSVGHAILSGKKAAISIDSYLRGKDSKETFVSIQVGGKGGISMEAYLHPKERNIEKKKVVGFEEINTSYFEKTPRLKGKALPQERAIRGFDEINLGLDRAKAIRSAERCFQCGLCNGCRNCYVFCPDLSVSMKKEGPEIDYDHCKGCGICVKECPRGALNLVEES